MNKNILKTLVLSLVIIFSFSSCVVKAKNYSKSYSDCNIKSKKWELSYEQVNFNLSACNGSPEPLPCLALMGVALPVVSTLISGSIVLVGNTIHWLEYEYKCDEKTINKEKTKLLKEL